MATSSTSATQSADGAQEFSTTLGPQGRVVIPAAIRRKLNLEAGAVLTLWEEDGKIHLRSRAAARNAARQLFQDAHTSGNLVAELIAERSAEADSADQG